MKSKIEAKIPPKITKMKKVQLIGRQDSIQSTAIMKQIKYLQGAKTTRTSSHSLEDWGDLSLLSSLH
jgi:hypothetical protein